MIDPKTQPLKVRISFAYDADIFDGDPDDAFEIASLEAGDLEPAIREAISELFGEYRNLTVSIQPE